jgi:2-C-methyl-D-erythritol 4-phosphate cytidylyltransferase
MMSTWAIVVAAGSGSRFGERKQYRSLNGVRLLDWALRVPVDRCDGVVLVVPRDQVDQVEPTVDAVVAGGATRSASVRSGLAAVPDDADVIVVHDGARPVPVPEVWARVITAVHDGADAAIPVVPVTDTLWSDGSGALADGSIDRSGVFAVQTPQAFKRTALWKAHAGGGEASDDATLVRATGGRVVLVDGDPANVKVTTPIDLSVAELLCR